MELDDRLRIIRVLALVMLLVSMGLALTGNHPWPYAIGVVSSAWMVQHAHRRLRALQ